MEDRSVRLTRAVAEGNAVGAGGIVISIIILICLKALKSWIDFFYYGSTESIGAFDYLVGGFTFGYLVLMSMLVLLMVFHVIRGIAGIELPELPEKKVRKQKEIEYEDSPVTANYKKYKASLKRIP